MSKFARSDAGIHSEVGMVGPEGLFPLCGLLQVASYPHVVISQIGEVAGRRIRAREFHAIVDGCAEAEDLIRRYVYAFFTQVSSNIVTSEQGTVDRRIARWLLMCHDRIEGDSICITHETLAQMACAQRPTVTNTLKQMREEGLVEIARGMITILDRPRLFQLADGTYGPSEEYWRTHIGPFGKDMVKTDREAIDYLAPLRMRRG